MFNQKEQAVIEYRTGLFYGDTFNQALDNLLKRYNPTGNARMQLHKVIMLQENQTVIMRKLRHEGTYSLASIKKALGRK